MAIFGNKDKDGNFTINFMAVKDTPIWDELNAISVTMLEDKLEFKNRINKNKGPIYLEYSKITKFGTVNEKEITEKDKSVIKRGLAGGLLLGPIGAVIGAVEGTGSKKKVTYKSFFVFNYTSGDGEEKSLPVEIVGATLGLSKFAAELQKKCPNLKQNNENNDGSPTYL